MKARFERVGGQITPFGAIDGKVKDISWRAVEYPARRCIVMIFTHVTPRKASCFGIEISVEPTVQEIAQAIAQAIEFTREGKPIRLPLSPDVLA